PLGHRRDIRRSTGTGQGRQAGIATERDIRPHRNAGPYADMTGKPIESLFQAPPIAEQERMLEAVLFASPEPLSTAQLQSRLPHGCDVPEALVHLRRRYEGRGVRLVQVGDGYAFRTAPDLGFLMQHEQVETRKLSRAAIET